MPNIKHFPPDFWDTPLHSASMRGDIVEAKNIIEQGIYIDSKNKDHRTPLHFAVVGGHTSMAEFLIASGANVNAKDNAAGTPLHLAAIRGYKDLVILLIEKGALIEATDNIGMTALHTAIIRGHQNVVEFLISRGAYVNSSDKKGVTPLHIAAYKGHKGIVEFLISQGANSDLKTKAGESALDSARQQKHHEIVSFLKQHEAKRQLKIPKKARPSSYKTYQNKKYGFSIQVPVNWKKQRRLISFISSGGIVAFEHNNGGLNISVGKLPADLPIDKKLREQQILSFLNKNISEMGQRIDPYVVDDNLSNELNTAWGEFKPVSHSGDVGTRGLISIVHNELEYTIQYFYSSDFEEEVQRILSSFQFSNIRHRKSDLMNRNEFLLVTIKNVILTIIFITPFLCIWIMSMIGYVPAWFPMRESFQNFISSPWLKILAPITILWLVVMAIITHKREIKIKRNGYL